MGVMIRDASSGLRSNHDRCDVVRNHIVDFASNSGAFLLRYTKLISLPKAFNIFVLRYKDLSISTST